MLGHPLHVYVDSDYRISGTSSNFQFKINLPSNNNYDSVGIMQATLPKSYYIVQSPFNTITLKEDAKTATITMTPGNYSINSFRTCLITELNAQSPNGYIYNITAPTIASQPSTGKYTFTVTGNGAIQPELIFPSSSSLYRQCGFEWNSTNQFVGDTLTSSNVVNFTPFAGLMILSDLCEASASDEIHGVSPLMEVFNFNISDFSNINFQTFDILATAKKLRNNQTNYCTFTITDLDGYVVNFNGQPVNFSLVFFKRDMTNMFTYKEQQIKLFQERLQAFGQEEEKKETK